MTFLPSLLSIFSPSSTSPSPIFRYSSLHHFINAFYLVVPSCQSHSTVISYENTSNLPNSMSWRGKNGRKLLRLGDGASGGFWLPPFSPSSSYPSTFPPSLIRLLSPSVQSFLPCLLIYGAQVVSSAPGFSGTSLQGCN